MKFFLLILSVWIFIKTISYGIFEIKTNKNKPGGIAIFFIATIGLILPNLMNFLR